MMAATPTTTWMKLTRRFGGDGNPLRRRSDLVEAWLLPAAIAAFLVLGPIVAVVTVAWVHADEAAARHAELSWHRVEAVLLQAVPGPEMSGDGTNGWLSSTPARWTVSGRRYRGDVQAAAGSRAGSGVPVWLDRAGTVQAPPLTPAQLGDRAVTAALIALAILAMVLAGVACLGKRALDKRRLASWETAWLAVGPRWSHLA
jgi:hypothetical protein